MDILDELEAMAVVIESSELLDDSLQQETVQRWSQLFNFTAIESKKRIEAYRADLGKLMVPDSHWVMIQKEKEAEGHSRESYAFSLTLAGDRQHWTTNGTSLRSSKFLFKFENPIDDIALLTNAIAFATKPPVVNGTDEDGHVVKFCELDGLQREQVEYFITSNHPDFLPTFIPVSRAQKHLSSTSLYPMLGIDTTMPQYRPINCAEIFHPAQNEYPVWYFFYGTLADHVVLSRLLGARGEYCPAQVRGGKLKTWGKKYLTLTDDSDGSVVCGSAFLVETQDQEDALRMYETDKYEVVRCKIEMEGQSVDGLTSRFIGEAD